MTATPETPCTHPAPPGPHGAVSAALGAMHAHTEVAPSLERACPVPSLAGCAEAPQHPFLNPLFIRKHTTAERSRESQVLS